MPRAAVKDAVMTRLCGACGEPMYRVHGEKKYRFDARQTCNTKKCRDAYAEHGRRFPMYREPLTAAQGVVLDARTAALVLARRLPAFLFAQPVEKAVENPVSL